MLFFKGMLSLLNSMTQEEVAEYSKKLIDGVPVAAFVIVANIMKSIVNITDSMVDMITGSMMSLTQGGGRLASRSPRIFARNRR